MRRVIVRGRLERAADNNARANALIVWDVGEGKKRRRCAIPTRFPGDDVLEAILAAGSPLIEADGLLIRTERGTEFLALKVLPLRADVPGRGVASI